MAEPFEGTRRRTVAVFDALVSKTDESAPAGSPPAPRVCRETTAEHGGGEKELAGETSTASTTETNVSGAHEAAPDARSEAKMHKPPKVPTPFSALRDANRGYVSRFRRGGYSENIVCEQVREQNLAAPISPNPSLNGSVML